MNVRHIVHTATSDGTHLLSHFMRGYGQPHYNISDCSIPPATLLHRTITAPLSRHVTPSFGPTTATFCHSTVFLDSVVVSGIVTPVPIIRTPVRTTPFVPATAFRIIPCVPAAAFRITPFVPATAFRITP